MIIMLLVIQIVAILLAPALRLLGNTPEVDNVSPFMEAVIGLTGDEA